MHSLSESPPQVGCAPRNGSIRSIKEITRIRADQVVTRRLAQYLGAPTKIEWNKLIFQIKRCHNLENPKIKFENTVIKGKTVQMGSKLRNLLFRQNYVDVRAPRQLTCDSIWLLNKKMEGGTETRCIFETSQKCSSDSKPNTLHSSNMYYKHILNFEIKS